MKKIFKVYVLLHILFFIPFFSLLAQSPEKISYQAVIRNSSNQLVTNQIIGMRISILRSSAIGTVVYTETQTPTSNANGLISIEIGNGAGFNSFNWASGPYFIKTEADPNGLANYTITGVSQVLSVPYALYAKTAETVTGTISETDPIFTLAPAKAITSTNITNWNSAYSWGNHSGLYRSISYVPSWNEISSNPFVINSAANNQLLKYNSTSGRWENWTPNFLTSFSETDPVWTAASTNFYTKTNLQTSGASQLHFTNLTNKPTTLSGYGISDAMNTSHDANSISLANITNWNTAFGWGNHAGLYRPISYIPAWSEITSKPEFSSVATSGNYDDLTNKPTINNTQWTTSGSDISYSAGRVGIATTTPGTKLDVAGGFIRVQESDNVPTGNVNALEMGFFTSGGYAFLQGYNRGTNTFLPIEFSGSTVGFRANGLTAMKVITNGNVGIGTSLPDYKLDVQGMINASGGFCIAGNCISSWAGLSPWLKYGENLYFNTGNVGIGTENPSAKLQVNGEAIIDKTTGRTILTLGSTSGATPFFTFGGSSGGIIQTTHNTLSLRFSSETSSASSVDFEPAKVTFRTGGFAGYERLTINSVGNVGIGTTNPSSKLDVNGTITATSFVKSSGTSSQFLKADGSIDANTYMISVREAADEFSATASQTSFTLSQTPSATSKVKMYINGVRISNTAYSTTGTTLTYIPANNGSYTLTVGDRIQFDYVY